MAKLENRSKNQLMIGNLEIARGFWSRGKGLLGRQGLAADSALWIHRCNSIHTFFMQFPIDCVFVDRNLKVKAIYQDVRPWRLLLPVWGASSVFELSSGAASRMDITVGDQLYVGS
jgi:uncharacterized membrane protein (UPF0127 family)